MLPSITEVVRARSVVLQLRGEFDLASRDQVDEALRRIEGYAPDLRVHVDLSRVSYIDCGSLRMIARLVRRRHTLGDPATVVVTSPILRIVVELMDIVAPDDVVDRLDDTG